MRAVLERDFVYEGSRPRAFRSRTYLGLVVAVAVVFVLVAYRAQLLAAPDRVASYVFRTGAAAVLVVLALLTPASVVGAVLAERMQETLALVLVSPVGPRQFAAAKLIARTGVILSWGLAALLPLGITVLLGGVGMPEVLRFAGAAAAVVIELGAWSLWVSTVSRRPATAALLAYLLPAARIAACLVAGFGWLGAGTAVEARVGRILLETTPVPAFVEVVDPGAGVNLVYGYRTQVLHVRSPRGPNTRTLATPAPAPISTSEPVLVNLAAALGLALLSVLLSGRRLRTEGEPRPEYRIPGLHGMRRRRVRHPPNYRNPVAWREGSLLNTGASRPLYYGALFAIVAVEIGFVLSMRRYSEWGMYGVSHWVAVQLVSLFSWFSAGLCLVAAVNGASSIAHERTQGTWDLLRASPLTTEQIVVGKVRGLMKGALFLALVPAAHLWIGLLTGSLSSSLAAALGAVLLADLLLFWTVVGMLCGALARVPGRALFLAVSAFAAGFLGIPILAALLGGYWTRVYLPIGPGMGEAMGAASPWTLPYDALIFVHDFFSANPVRGEYGYGNDRPWQMTALALWALGWGVALPFLARWLLRILVRRLASESLDARPAEAAR